MAGAYHDLDREMHLHLGMLNLGHNHPDFVYPNDQKQAKLALLLSGFASVMISALIVLTVLKF
jgi:hypothetical protein